MLAPSGMPMTRYAPVAQLDRAIASDAMCRAFESHQAYQIHTAAKLYFNTICGCFFVYIAR